MDAATGTATVTVAVTAAGTAAGTAPAYLEDEVRVRSLVGALGLGLELKKPYPNDGPEIDSNTIFNYPNIFCLVLMSIGSSYSKHFCTKLSQKNCLRQFSTLHFIHNQDAATGTATVRRPAS